MVACAAFFGTKPGNTVDKKRVAASSLLLLALVPALVFVDRQKVSNSPEVMVFKYRREAAPLMISKEYSKALDKLNAAQSLCGDKITSVLFDRAIALDKLDHYDLALKDIDLWLSREKDDVQALMLKSTIQHNLGQDQEAIDTVTRSLDIKPTTLLDYFKGAVKGNMGQAMLYNNRAWYKLSLGQPKQALEEIDKSLSIDPRLATAYDTRGSGLLPAQGLQPGRKRLQPLNCPQCLGDKEQERCHR